MFDASKIACYLRVSSSSQKTDSQRHDLELWLKGQGLDPNEVQWFEDKETGKTMKRHGLLQLQKAIFNGEVKTVVVWKLDRISRRLKDGVNALADWCDAACVSLRLHSKSTLVGQ